MCPKLDLQCFSFIVSFFLFILFHRNTCQHGQKMVGGSTTAVQHGQMIMSVARAFPCLFYGAIGRRHGQKIVVSHRSVLCVYF
jgi:ABC-type phosphate/phosphonate transport system permease subunit